MLLSPGQSPRHISSPSPSAPGTPSSSHRNVAAVTAEPSSSRTSKHAKVLDEDTYAAAVERIIERDYFPDIPKLRDRLDWLEAGRSNDPVIIRDTHLKIIERRRELLAASVGFGGGDTGMRSKSRAATGTPGSTFFRGASFTPCGFEDHSGKINQNRKSDVDGEGSDSGGQSNGESEIDPSLSLDEFFRRFTSEDNESFNKIMERGNRKRKERYAHLLEGEKPEDVKLIEGEKRETVATDGFGTSDQPTFTLDGWKYTAKNLLMYHPTDRGEAPLTEEEKAERLKGLTKVISKTNTRFTGKMVDYKENADDTVEVMYTPVAGGTPHPMLGREDKMKRYDLEDLRKTPHQFYVESEKKADNGYNFVKTPSPAPGVDGSPFMTWGEIEGTPLRLEPEDTPIDIGGSGEGAHFKIPMPPTRDVKAHSMSREAARKIRERTKLYQKPPLHSPRRGGSASPARTLSPAAQKFVRKAIAKSSHDVDESLRASYRGASPGASTPKAGRSLSRFGSIMSMSPSK